MCAHIDFMIFCIIWTFQIGCGPLHFEKIRNNSVVASPSKTNERNKQRHVLQREFDIYKTLFALSTTLCMDVALNEVVANSYNFKNEYPFGIEY